jgi:hypothetical protein
MNRFIGVAERLSAHHEAVLRGMGLVCPLISQDAKEHVPLT